MKTVQAGRTGASKPAGVTATMRGGLWFPSHAPKDGALPVQGISTLTGRAQARRDRCSYGRVGNGADGHRPRSARTSTDRPPAPFSAATSGLCKSATARLTLLAMQ
jgi:hypothetical protein